MTLFHLAFMLVGVLALFLMVTNVIPLDWTVLGIITLAIILNAFFGAMWLKEPTDGKTSEHKIIMKTNRTFPMISLVISAYNQEQNIAQRIKELFNCASNYRGPSEIIVVDDGSLDETYESAWNAVTSLQTEAPNIVAHVIKHMTHLGKTDATKTGANKAMGEYLALIDFAVPCDSISLNKLVDTLSSTQKPMISYEASLAKQEAGIAPSHILLYRADAFRHLNEE